ncbi:MAG: hypothetical protein OSA97_06920 [Nevskia sp.]|nr:hypothetical protein [Nevskia sp.]
MDSPTFIVEVVKASAWPIAAVTSALLFRAQLNALLSRVRKGKLGIAEFEFEETVKALQRKTIDSAPAIDDDAIVLLLTDPRSAILESWEGVEDAARHLVQTLGVPSSVNLGRPTQLAKVIEEKRALAPDQINLFRDLRDLRNEVAVPTEFAPLLDSAIRYVRLAKGLKGDIERAVNSIAAGE